MATKADKHAAIMTIHDLAHNDQITTGQMTRLAVACDMDPDLIGVLRCSMERRERGEDTTWPLSVVAPRT